jgi:hypothetical protein
MRIKREQLRKRIKTSKQELRRRYDEYHASKERTPESELAFEALLKELSYDERGK